MLQQNPASMYVVFHRIFGCHGRKTKQALSRFETMFFFLITDGMLRDKFDRWNGEFFLITYIV
jgi:hypothetical protein